MDHFLAERYVQGAAWVMFTAGVKKRLRSLKIIIHVDYLS